MAVDGREPVLGWWSPDPRGIVPLDGLRVTRSMRQSAKHFEVRVDTCFADVIRACADPSRDSGWISGEFIEAFTAMHRLGWAHSVEAFDRDRGGWPAACTACASTACSRASRCFTSSVMRRRSR